MQLIVLGCHGPYPCPNGTTSGYLLVLPEGNVLLDCGAGVAGRLLALSDPASLRGVILSHLHYDHMSDLYVLRYYLERMKKSLLVYLPRAEMDSPVAKTLLCGVFSLYPLEDLTDIAGAEVASLRVNHPIPTCAVRLCAEGKTLVYTGDTNVCEELSAFSKGADLLLADGGMTDAQWRETSPHMSARIAAQTANAAGVKRLLITHLSPDTLPSTLLNEAREAFPDSFVAAPGVTFTL